MSRTIYDAEHFCQVLGKRIAVTMIEGSAKVCPDCNQVIGVMPGPKYWDDTRNCWSDSPGSGSSTFGIVKKAA